MINLWQHQKVLLGNISILLILLRSGDCKDNDSKKFPLYQGEAIDVLRDVSTNGTYSAIYLQYHGCVWSEYGNGADEHDNGCGGDGGDEHWYMGRTQCYRANVAYSLYGIPKGESASSKPCSSKHFINSFFTTNGVESFAESAEVDNGYATSYCTVQENNDNGNNNGGNDDDGDNNQENDEDGSYEHNQLIYKNYKSYTTTCSAKGKFVQTLFKGAYCSGKKIETLDTLDDFNEILEDFTCVQIYSDGDNDSNAGQDGGANEATMGLLAYSESCSTLEYPTSCPDPFGAKIALDFHPTGSNKFSLNGGVSWIDWLTIAFFLAAIVLLAASCCYYKKPELERGRTRKREPSSCNKVKREGTESSRTKSFRGWIRKKIFRRKN